MSMRMDGWKVSFDGTRSKIVQGPALAVITCYRTYDGREVPEARIVESLHRDKPNLDGLHHKYQFPAPGSVKQYDFAYGRMLTAAPAGGGWSYDLDPDLGHEPDAEYVPWDAEDLPGVEKVYRKVEVVRLTDDEIRDLYVDWARSCVSQETESPSVDFALHVLAELSAEP
jgi:hypothetical protein